MKYPQLVSMPSAISVWLEEQLESRGIDSEIYTRYLLSLLHAHTLDVIHPEDDFSGLKKEERKRSAVSHKRLRRSASWWRHAHVNAEQIKRSAAVKCLMSAAEQSCEVESLVDELCKKLKEVNSEADPTIKEAKALEPTSITSPSELAEKYYAAFPPLNKEEEGSYLASNIKLIVSQWPSPEKNQLSLLARKWTRAGSPKKSKKKPRRQLFEANMKSTPRNKFGHKRTHCGRSLTREMADNAANWEYIYNNVNNNNYQIQDQALDPVLTDANLGEPAWAGKVCRMNVWLKNAKLPWEPATSNNDGSKRTRISDKWQQEEQIPESGADKVMPWSLEGEESAIRDEYQRSVSHEIESAIKEEYFQPRIWHGSRYHRDGYAASDVIVSPMRVESDALDFGLVSPDAAGKPGYEEIVSAIKAEYDRPRIIYNPEPRAVPLDYYVDAETVSCHVDLGPPKSVDDERIDRQNANNSLLEDMHRRGVVPSDMYRRCAEERLQCQDVAKMFDELKTLFDDRTVSLMMINHSMNTSAFREYSCAELQTAEGLHPYSHPFGRPMQRPRKLAEAAPPLRFMVVPAQYLPEEEKKKTPPHMYFQPIRASAKDGSLPDGYSFDAAGHLEEVKIHRSGTGSMFIESEDGEYRRCFEYTTRPSSDESSNLSDGASDDRFRIKYCVSSNNKACQTDEAPDSPPFAPVVLVGGADDEFDLDYEVAFNTSQNDLDMDAVTSGKDPISPDFLVWGCAPKCSCGVCNARFAWPRHGSDDDDGQADDLVLKEIWRGAEVLSPRMDTPAFLVENAKTLREESKDEAETLLSDLSSLQLSYSAKLQEFPFETSNDEPTGKKRRHSYISNGSTLWSFATSLEENCLINLSTLPTRRSVTL